MAMLHRYHLSCFLFRATAKQDARGETGEEVPAAQSSSAWAIAHVATAKQVQMSWSPFASTTRSIAWAAALALPWGAEEKFIHVLVDSPFLTVSMNNSDKVHSIAAEAEGYIHESYRWMIEVAAEKGTEHDEILVPRAHYEDLFLISIPGSAIPAALADRLRPLCSRRTAQVFMSSGLFPQLEQDVHSWLLSQV